MVRRWSFLDLHPARDDLERTACGARRLHKLLFPHFFRTSPTCVSQQWNRPVTFSRAHSSNTLPCSFQRSKRGVMVQSALLEKVRTVSRSFTLKPDSSHCLRLIPSASTVHAILGALCRDHFHSWLVARIFDAGIRKLSRTLDLSCGR